MILNHFKFTQRSKNFVANPYFLKNLRFNLYFCADINESSNLEDINYRINLWNTYKSQTTPKSSHLNINIKETKLFQQEIKGTANQTTPFDLLKQVQDLKNHNLNDFLVAKVNGTLTDLNQPLEQDCEIEYLTFEDPEAKEVFWHSSAHILGHALEKKYNCSLIVGPATQQGFFYDFFIENKENPTNSIAISPNDFPELSAMINKIIKSKEKFEKLELTKEDALKLFKNNSFKLDIISKIDKNDSITAYKCGNLIDLCRGPHIPNTSFIKGFSILKNSSALWQDKNAQRLYGISFPKKELMSEWKTLQEQFLKRDHRTISKQQKLMFFHESSPGSAFMLPHGTHIYNKLSNLIRDKYVSKGFLEVITPTFYSNKLFETSGHAQNYSENMFTFDIENQSYSLKPMNCPAHCIIFDQMSRSYRELPLRLADFGALHRNEFSGSLTGLTRVRKFQQDDAHIFCEKNQVKQEIKNCIDFMKEIYQIFGFEFSLELSTRPDNYLGSLEDWDSAENSLKEVLEDSKLKWVINPGDGAFYGPKIDIQISDALKRTHQCATVQLDFQLPQRFNLKYQDRSGGVSQPVIIHRAILGSVERMMAILIEHYSGIWPFWISPRQCKIIPIAEEYLDYAKEITENLKLKNIQCSFDDSSNKLNKKIRDAQLDKFNFICVVGQKEKENNTLNLRCRDTDMKEYEGELDLEKLNDMFDKLTKEYK